MNTQIQKKTDASNGTDLKNQIINETNLQTEDTSIIKRTSNILPWNKRSLMLCYTTEGNKQTNWLIGKFDFKENLVKSSESDFVEKKQNKKKKADTTTKEAKEDTKEDTKEEAKESTTPVIIPYLHQRLVDDDRIFYLWWLKDQYAKYETVKSIKVQFVYTLDSEFLELKSGMLNLYDKSDVINPIKQKTMGCKEGDWSAIKYYLTNLMGKDGYEPMINFLAYKMKNPLELLKIAFVFKGNNRVGKSFLYEVLLPNIFGETMVIPLKIGHKEDFKWNFEFINNSFIPFEEFTINDKETTNGLKAMITSTRVRRREKGQKEHFIPNHSTLIFSMNEKPAFLQTEEKSDRFVYIEIPNTFTKENPTYDTKVSEKDFKSQIPAFIHYLQYYQAKMPVYSDFNACNKIIQISNKTDKNLIVEAIYNIVEGKYKNSLAERKVEGIYFAYTDTNMDLFRVEIKKLRGEDRFDKTKKQYDINMLIDELEGLNNPHVVCVKTADKKTQRISGEQKKAYVFIANEYLQENIEFMEDSDDDKKLLTINKK